MTHADTMIHTESVMTMCKLSIISESIIHKLNTKSTEAELFDVNDIIPEVLLTGYFLNVPYYESFKSVMDQDNKSEVLLEQHGIFSNINRKKHISMTKIFY